MSPRTPVPSFAPLTALLAFAASAAAQITPGNLAVVRVGDGSAALTSASTAVFLDQFDRTTPGGALGTIALPTAATLPQFPLTNSGSATSEGYLTQSVDGNYLVHTGYGTGPGTASIAGTASTAVNRVIARIALDGTVDTSTALTDAFNANNPRSAVTVDGTSFWAAGAGSTTPVTNRGVVYASGLGTTTSTQLGGAFTNGRVIGIFGDQLFVSSQSGSNVGINTVGTGLPTTTGQSVVLLNGFTPPIGTPNQYDFWLADAATLYVADERSMASGGGIQKWTESAGTWTLAYTLSPGTGCRGLSGIRDQSGTHLYATTTQVSANQLVTVDDTGIGATFTTLATAPTNTVFRGVRFVRTPNSATLAGTGCTTSVGIPTIAPFGAPVSGNGSFGIAVGNTPIFSLYLTVVSIGLPLGGGFPLSFVLDTPACTTLYPQTLDILLAGVTDITGSGVTPLGLPTPDNTLWGLVLGTQHLVFDGAFYPTFGYPLGATQGLQITVGN